MGTSRAPTASSSNSTSSKTIMSAMDSHSKSLWPRRLHHIPAVCLLCYSGLEPIRYRRSGLHISTHLGNVLHMHPRCSRSESNIHRCSDSGSIHPLRHASHDIGHGWSAGSEDSSHRISCRPSLRLPHTIVPRIRWWYELGTYAKLHQENVAKHCSSEALLRLDRLLEVFFRSHGGTGDLVTVLVETEMCT